MNPTTAFLANLGLVAVLSVSLVVYVKSHLSSLLIELCGTPPRASFWLAFSNVSLVLVPLIFALDYKPESAPEKALVFEIAGQLKYALIGFIITLGSLALILFRFIPREKANAPGHPLERSRMAGQER